MRCGGQPMDDRGVPILKISMGLGRRYLADSRQRIKAPCRPFLFLEHPPVLSADRATASHGRANRG